MATALLKGIFFTIGHSTRSVEEIVALVNDVVLP
jgi:hypothetical protein